MIFISHTPCYNLTITRLQIHNYIYNFYSLLLQRTMPSQFNPIYSYSQGDRHFHIRTRSYLLTVKFHILYASDARQRLESRQIASIPFCTSRKLISFAPSIDVTLFFATLASNCRSISSCTSGTRASYCIFCFIGWRPSSSANHWLMVAQIE